MQAIPLTLHLRRISLSMFRNRLEQNVQTTTTCQCTHDTRTDAARRAATTLLHISLRRRVSLLLIVHGLATLGRISLRRVASLLRRVASLLRRHEAAVVWIGCGRGISLLGWVVAVLGRGGARVAVVGCCFAAAAVGGSRVGGWRAGGCVLFCVVLVMPSFR